MTLATKAGLAKLL